MWNEECDGPQRAELQHGPPYGQTQQESGKRRSRYHGRLKK
jgi:hypothetical protein